VAILLPPVGIGFTPKTRPRAGLGTPVTGLPRVLSRSICGSGNTRIHQEEKPPSKAESSVSHFSDNCFFHSSIHVNLRPSSYGTRGTIPLGTYSIIVIHALDCRSTAKSMQHQNRTWETGTRGNTVGISSYMDKVGRGTNEGPLACSSPSQDAPHSRRHQEVLLVRIIFRITLNGFG
jgi:hypothetical protein